MSDDVPSRDAASRRRAKKRKRRDDDGDCVRFASRHGDKLDEETLARFLSVAETIATTERGRATIPPDDPRFHY